MTKKVSIFIIAILLVCLVVISSILVFKAKDESMEDLSFYDSESQLTLTPYYDDEDDIFYLFLPAFIDPENVMENTSGSLELSFSFEGSKVDKIAEIPIGQDAAITIKNGEESKTCAFKILQTKNLMTTYIDTESGSLENINKDKENIEDAAVLFIDEDAEVMSSGTAEISGRGNGSWAGAKKPYNLNFDREISVGDFDSVSKLCLFAEYSDESKLRNSTGYLIAREMDIDYASAYMYTDLYINGEYLGLYGIATKDEYTKKVEEDGIKAVFEIAYGEDDNQFYSSLGCLIKVIYGDVSEVEELVNSYEAALSSQDWDLCEKYIDIASVARLYSLEELVSNFDLPFSSQYFYINDDNEICGMMPWDLDFSLGSIPYAFDEKWEDVINAYRIENCWYCRLIEDENFRDQIVSILKDESSDNLLQKVSKKVFQYAKDIDTSRQCDLTRWKNSEPYNTYNISSGLSDVGEFASYFSTSLEKHLSFMKDYFSNNQKYCHVKFLRPGSDSVYAFVFCLPKGTNLAEYLKDTNVMKVSGTSKILLEWKTEDGLTPEDFTSVTGDIVFKGSYETISNDADETVDQENDGNRLTRLLQKIKKYAPEATFIGIFGIILVVLLVLFAKDVISKKKVK